MNQRHGYGVIMGTTQSTRAPCIFLESIPNLLNLEAMILMKELFYATDAGKSSNILSGKKGSDARIADIPHGLKKGVITGATIKK